MNPIDELLSTRLSRFAGAFAPFAHDVKVLEESIALITAAEVWAKAMREHWRIGNAYETEEMVRLECELLVLLKPPPCAHDKAMGGYCPDCGSAEDAPEPLR